VTGRIFLELIGGAVFLLLLAAISVDYFATEVMKTTYIGNLMQQLTDKARALERAAGGRISYRFEESA
jgi:hypothetical protein